MLDQLTFEMWSEAERTWMPHGLCKTGKLPAKAWKCGENGTMELRGREVKCSEVTSMAVMVCQTCPVQWDCVKFAVQVGEEWGSWGCHIRYLRWLQGLDEADAILIIDDAQAEGVPVEVAVRDAKKARRATGMRVASAA